MFRWSRSTTANCAQAHTASHAFALCILVALLVVSPSIVHAQEAVIQHSVFGSGGGVVSDHTGVTLQATLGQPMTGISGNGNAISASGFWYLWGKPPTSTAVEDDPPSVRELPTVTQLHPNAPNPFNPSTSIRFDLARDGAVRLELFDLRGRRVDVLIDARMSAGEHDIVYRPRELPSGTYFYRLVTLDAEMTRRMVLVR